MPVELIAWEEAPLMRGIAEKLAVLVIAFDLLVGAPAAAGAQQPIRVGASLSLTGTYAALGQNQHRGYQLCMKHANEKGGILGRKIELTAEDDQSEPARAVAIYERLIARDKVGAVFSPYGSPITDAVTPGRGSSSSPTGGSSPASISPITPLTVTAVVRFSSRRSGAPGPWTARNSAKQF